MSTSVIAAPQAVPTGSPAEPVLHDYTTGQITQMLPHRAPMLLIDRAYDVNPGVSGRGVKAVSVNEPYFAGHYPGKPIMPGVMIVESMAQLVAVVYVSEYLEKTAPGNLVEDPSDHVGYLGAIKSMKFNRLVVPGDVLKLEAHLGTRFGALRTVRVSASIEHSTVARGELIVSEQT